MSVVRRRNSNGKQVSKETKENLVEAVKNCQMLWDKKCPSYQNSEVKSAAWAQFDEEFGIDCKTAWKNIKNSYSKYRNDEKKATRSGAGGGSQVKWHLWTAMSFFKDNIEDRDPNGVSMSYSESVPSPSIRAAEYRNAGEENLSDDSDSESVMDNGVTTASQSMNTSTTDEETFVSKFLPKDCEPMEVTVPDKKRRKTDKSSNSDFVEAMKAVMSGIKPPPLPPARKPSDGVESLPDSIRKVVVGLGHLINMHGFAADQRAIAKFRDGATKLAVQISDDMVESSIDQFFG